MPQPRLINDGHRYQYAVEKHTEGMLGTMLFGASAFNPAKLSNIINKRANAGYRMVFQIKEQRRMLIFWKRECILMTFERSLS